MTSDSLDSDLDTSESFEHASFDDVMELHDRGVSGLRYRWEMGQVFLAELRAVTLGRAWVVMDSFWDYCVEAQKNLAADVQAWVDRLAAEDGVFRGLASTPRLLAQLRPQYPEGQTVNPAIAALRRRTFEERFGATDELRPEDIRDLEHQTLRCMPPIAMAYPSKDDAPAPNPAALLEAVHQVLDEHLRYADRLCRDLRICAGAPPSALRSFIPRDQPVRARARIDLILLGRQCGILDDKDHPDPTHSTPAYTAHRARMYAALHAIDADPQSPFNSPANIQRMVHVDLMRADLSV